MTQIQPTQQQNKLPDFTKMSREEEATWWDTHDFTDYLSEFEPAQVHFALDKPRDDTLIVRVQGAIKKELSQIAKSKGLNVSSLARMWLLEKLNAEKQQRSQR